MLESIVRQEMLKEREQVLDIIISIDKEIFNENLEESEFRVTNEVKSVIRSSIELRDCISSELN